jgi:sialic acid synthase SpsE
MRNYVEINKRRIGPGEPVYIVAEMSANHNQDFDKAVQIIKSAAEKLPKNSILTLLAFYHSSLLEIITFNFAKICKL